MAFRLSAFPMPKPSFVSMAERSGAVDLTSPYGADPAGFVGGGLFSRSGKRDLVFVVNPKSANGRTEREWKKLLPYLRGRLSGCCNIHVSFTSGASHGTDITREAIRDGADVVISVGGDGTLQEVVNGFFVEENPIRPVDQGLEHSTALGLIPLGTGSDFARTFGWRNDPHEAIERIIRGYRSKLDVGCVKGHGGEQRYFINVADVHLSAKAGYCASKYKGWGNISYVIGALRAFVGHENRDFRIKVDEGKWEVLNNVTALCVGNAKYFGGGMKITPTADPSSGYLEVVILQNFKWYDFVLKLHKLYSGSHVSEQNVSVRSVKLIEVEEVLRKGDIYVQCDGEHIGFLPAKFSILPAAIDMLI